MRRWCWWRRCSGFRMGSRAGNGDRLGTEEDAVPRCFALGCGSAHSASFLGFTADYECGRRSHSFVSDVVHAFRGQRETWRPAWPAQFSLPCVRRMSTKSARSHPRAAFQHNKEEGKGAGEEEEVEACPDRGTRGRRGPVVADEAEPDLNGSWVEEWEEEEETEPEIGDGGDGGGIVLGDVEWGERALSIANEVLRLHFDEDTKLFAFKVSPKGYVYVRLDNLSNLYGCPTMEEIEKFSSLYSKRLEESGETEEIPKDLALEVSTPGAERLLKVPEDLDRFKDMPMVVQYLEEDPETRQRELKEGFFLLESVDTEAGEAVWKLANVRENRDPLSRGKPISKKRREWRLRVALNMLKRVMLYVPL